MKFIEESVDFTQIVSNSESSHLEVQKIAAQLFKTHKNKKEKSKPTNRWTPQQNLLYVRFLKQNGQRLSKPCSKKYFKFQKMSFYVQSKSADQCRSHHQKMLIRFKSIDKIIQYLLMENKGIKEVLPVQKNQKIRQAEVEEIQAHFENQNVEGQHSLQSQFINKLNEILIFKQERYFMDEQIFDVLF